MESGRPPSATESAGKYCRYAIHANNNPSEAPTITSNGWCLAVRKDIFGDYRLFIKRDTVMKPAATRGIRVITVFHTCPRLSRTFNLPAINNVRKPSPAKDTMIRTRYFKCKYLKNGH